MQLVRTVGARIARTHLISKLCFFYVFHVSFSFFFSFIFLFARGRKITVLPPSDLGKRDEWYRIHTVIIKYVPGQSTLFFLLLMQLDCCRFFRNKKKKATSKRRQKRQAYTDKTMWREWQKKKDLLYSAISVPRVLFWLLFCIYFSKNPKLFFSFLVTGNHKRTEGCLLGGGRWLTRIQ